MVDDDAPDAAACRGLQLGAGFSAAVQHHSRRRHTRSLAGQKFAERTYVEPERPGRQASRERDEQQCFTSIANVDIEFGRKAREGRDGCIEDVGVEDQ